MSIFSTILDKLGIKKSDDAAKNPPAGAPPVGAPKPGMGMPPPGKPGMPPAGKMAPGAMPPPGPRPGVARVDVVSMLDGLAKASPEKLDWKKSIVDLLKLLKMDSSLEARKALATELGCPPSAMTGDYSKMNEWLSHVVLLKIAEHGGNIPESLLEPPK